MTSSPLLEAQVNSLDEFFLRLRNNQIPLMPREILNQNLSLRVKNLREQRQVFTLEYSELLKEKENRKSHVASRKSYKGKREKEEEEILEF
jgi:hypothetical protein